MQRLFIIVLSFCVVASAVAAPTTTSTKTNTSPSKQQIARNIDNLIKKQVGNVNIGIVIKNLDTGKVIYEKNPKRSFVPASTMKVLTGFSGLLFLGPNYRYKTTILADNRQIHHGTLNSDVYIKFSGDPTLKISHLKHMIERLKQQGIHAINGDVYVDDTAFGTNDIGPGWMWDDTRYCFSAPTSAAMINGNCIHMQVKPNKSVGKPVQIIPIGSAKYVDYRNFTTTKAGKGGFCRLDLHSNINNIYTLDGCMRAHSEARGLSIAVQNPEIYAEKIIADLLGSAGIRVTGKVRTGSSRDSLVLLAQHQSKPLKELTKKMLKDSDNLIANSVFKTLGRQYYKSSGSWKNGAKAMKNIIGKSAKVDLKNSSIVDGAGLSRYDLITPQQLLDVLNYAYHDKAIKNDFMNALPTSGIDGTLKNRMGQAITIRKIRAKTGTMSHVTSLAGYITTKDKQTVGFAIMMNGAAGRLGKYRRLEDQICTYLAQINVKPKAKPKTVAQTTTQSPTKKAP
mgnify:CR=1 FL=1